MWPSIDLERSTFQGLDFVGRINASVKSEIQVRLVENWSGESGCQSDWYPGHTWLLPGEIRSNGPPPRGEGFFILVIDGELKTQQGSYSRHRSHPIPNRKKVKVLVDQSWLTLCNLMNCSPPGSSVHGILQASGCHSLFQAIVQAQALNPGLPPCRQILYQLSPREAPSGGELNS